MNSSKAAAADLQMLFQSQVEAHRRILYKVVSAYAWQREDQQDLTQEILLQLWRAFPNFDPRRTFSTWMYQVALNTAITWSRKASLRSRHHASADGLEQIPAAEERNSPSLELYTLIESLDELNRALLLLHLEEKTHQEIGEILGITPINVATKISRLKNRLRLEANQLNPEGKSNG